MSSPSQYIPMRRPDARDEIEFARSRARKNRSILLFSVIGMTALCVASHAALSLLGMGRGIDPAWLAVLIVGGVFEGIILGLVFSLVAFATLRNVKLKPAGFIIYGGTFVAICALALTNFVGFGSALLLNAICIVYLASMLALACRFVLPKSSFYVPLYECPWCGYDLRGVGIYRCPECGWGS